MSFENWKRLLQEVEEMRQQGDRSGKDRKGKASETVREETEHKQETNPARSNSKKY